MGWREYGHVSTVAWCVGRGRFLSQAAAAGTAVFATPAFAALEERARSNARSVATRRSSAALPRYRAIQRSSSILSRLAACCALCRAGASPAAPLGRREVLAGRKVDGDERRV